MEQALPSAARQTDWGAGLCVAALLLPEAVAYAGLAHVPVGHALAAVLIGLAVYGVLGGSRFAIVAPTSSTAMLVLAAALSMGGAMSDIGSAAYLQAVMALVLLSGLMLMVLGVARLGQLSSFISRPVLKGFAFALAVSIVIRQLPDALGLEVPAGAHADPLHILGFVLMHVAVWHGPSVALAVLAAVLVVGLRRWPQVPGSMVAMLVAMALVRGFDLQQSGVHVVGQVLAPPFAFGVPQLPPSAWLRAGELAFGLVMLVFAESWGSMRSMALRHGDTLNPDRELMVLGACNVASALFQGMPVGAGFSATSANAAAGAVSRKAGLIALLALVLVVALALPSLQYLPRPVLAVAVISALWHALSPQPMVALWRMNRDRSLLVAAVLAVFFLGVLDGMLAAIGLSMLGAMQRFSQPVVHELGELGTSRNYVDLHAQHGALSKPGLLIVRPEEPLFFGSAERAMAIILQQVASRTEIHTVVLSLEESADLDSTAVDCLQELRHVLQLKDKQLLLARAKTTVRELLARQDPQGLGASERIFWSVADAVESVVV
jgi:MFS superfamily sulfate permease-like transporter